jgi:hypothetical protein
MEADETNTKVTSRQQETIGAVQLLPPTRKNAPFSARRK